MKSLFKKLVVKVLIFEAKLLLSRHKPTIIAVTGSVGKTTTKDAIFEAIKGSVKARKSEKSFNSDIGVPLTVLGLKNAWSNPILWLKNLVDGLFIAMWSSDYPKVLVLEAGIDRPGDMKDLTNWINPDITVLTRFPNVPVHVEYFSTPDEVVKEKMRLVSATKTSGTVIYNNDDQVIKEQLPHILQTTVGYGRYLKTDFQGAHDRIVYEDNAPVGGEHDIIYDGQTYSIRTYGTIGTQHVYSSAAAMAVTKTLDLDLEKAAKALGAMRTPNGRMRIIKGLKSSVIIDDTYNSSPAAAELALQTLNEIKYAKRKIVVMGDMLELGQYSAEQHMRIGKMIPPIATILIAVGIRARKFAKGALEAGMPEENILQYDSAKRAGRELQNMLQPGDVVLVKASQGVRAEWIVEEIMAHPEQAGELLVRQDTAWQNR